MSDIHLKKYIVPTETEDKRIVLLTDIHYYNQKEQRYLKEILKKLKRLEYDYLVISGDLLDKSRVEDEIWLINWIKELALISKVLIGIGNHELVNGSHNCTYDFNADLYKKIDRIKNVKVLDNKTYVDGNIRFIGVTLPVDYYYRYNENKNYFVRYLNRLFPKPYSDKYNILICHTPIPFMEDSVLNRIACLSSISLILCGHMHGGIIRLADGRGLVGPFRGFFPKGAYGIFLRRKSFVVVSTGITKISQAHILSFLNNLFSKEITLVALQTKK